MAEKQTTLAFNALDGFTHLPIVKQVGLLIGIAASIAIGVAVALWANQPGMVPLFAGLDSKEAGEVSDTLTSLGISYRIDQSNGVLLVDSSKVYETRLKLASQGLPRSATNNGFEALGKDSNFGTSQFMEQAMFRNALENELARTISSLDAVKSARVHLALPRQSVFLRDSSMPSASVLVDIYSGRSLTKTQIAAITNLVASSVPDMDATAVTLVDQKGRLLSEESTPDMTTQTSKHLDIQKQIEDAYVKRIISLLTPILGDAHVKAEVNADIDFTAAEKTAEFFSPDQRVVRSEQTMEEYQNGARPESVSGIPGAASNIPNQTPAANTAPAPSNAQSSNGDIKKKDSRNYEIGKTISHTIHQPWAIKRISVAVAVDDLGKADPKGNVVKSPLSEEKLKQITALIKDAVGFTQERGDSVNVINLSFADLPKIEEIPEEPFWAKEWFWGSLRYVFAGLSILFLIMGVLRPLMKSLADGKMMFPPSNPGTDNRAYAEKQNDVVRQDEKIGVPRLPEASSSELASVEVVRNMLQDDPARVARVVMNWVGNEDE